MSPNDRHIIKTYKTKEGHTVKVYAPLYADGAFGTDYRVKPLKGYPTCTTRPIYSALHTD